MQESGTHSILFVDDEKNILKSLQRLFFDEDYTVLTAGSGREALELLAAGAKPTVIISDQRMPEMGGVEFLSRAREMMPQSIRMVLTGYADINTAVDSINLGGVYRYILKPWNDDELKMVVRQAVSQFELVEQNRRLTLELEEKNRELMVLNNSLELKVEERTRELQQVVRELQGRDRVQQYLMEMHPQQDLLETILAVTVDVSHLAGGAFFLREGGDEVSPVPAAAINFNDMQDGSRSPLLAEKMHQVWLAEEPAMGTILIAPHAYCLVPVRKGSKKFGILIVKKERESDFQVMEIQTFSSFASQAAIGISDCRLQESFDDIEASLDNVLLGIQG
jgi:CheY-like chemotaxis protein